MQITKQRRAVLSGIVTAMDLGLLTQILLTGLVNKNIFGWLWSTACSE